MHSSKKRKVQVIESSEDEVDEIKICETPKSCSEASQKDFRKYFTYETTAVSKFGVCQLCRENSGIRTEIKMKQSNTTGLKRHLMVKHVEVYESLFGKRPAAISSAGALQGQTNLERFVTVSPMIA